MSFMIGVDTGGTFTDGFFTHNGDLKTVKVLTTPHDLTVCLADCIREGARQFGVSVQDMLAETDIVRYSTTVSVNTIIQRVGSKIGLLVSQGFKDSLYSSDAKAVEPIFSFIARDMIDEVIEEIDDKGKIKKPVDTEDLIVKMQNLIDTGARAIVVSLNNSHVNPAHEEQVRAIIKEQSPSFFLGSIRVLLASDISDQPDAFSRTNAAVINGYIHDAMVRYLYRSEDDLRANLYTRPLMVGHSHGGTARVAKTRAIDTYSSGPVLGVFGAELVGKAHGYTEVVGVDVGGTSLDIGIIRGGTHNYTLTPIVSGLPVSVPMIVTDSVGIGGCSIVKLNSSGGLQIGPRSAGASPGPACFNRGGIEPTVTDADVTLGFIDPNNFLGGKVKLNKDKAIAAIKRRIADPVKITVEEAACLIRETTEKNIQKEILRFLKEKGIEPDKLADFALVAYGGAGPTRYAGFTSGLKFGKILTSPYASTFCAFGFSTTDLLHRYSKYLPLTLFDGVNYLKDFKKLNEAVAQLTGVARRDIMGEGFSADNAGYYLEFIGDGHLAAYNVKSEKIKLSSEEEVKQLCAQFGTPGEKGPAKVTVSTIILNAVVPMPHYELTSSPLAGEDPGRASRGERDVYWSPEVGYLKTPIYDRELLAPGNRVIGPAVVEAKDTTYVIPANKSYYIGEYSHGVLEEA
ncbi:MAG TPA: hydantoinase/oxoprolinase family protein [Dehalococcoidales bacterium]|nr:hydantoinase/oxoprolinase family protein [Dehalococcoidales bacterium]